MAKYKLNSIDMMRDIAVQTNVKNHKQRVFLVDYSNLKQKFKKWSKEYAKVSYIAPRQERDGHVLFIGTEEKYKDILLNTSKVIRVRKWDSKINNDYATRGLHGIKSGNVAIEEAPKHVEILPQIDDTYIIRHKSFGEVLYSEKYNSISSTYDFISAPDYRGYRLVVLNKDDQAAKRLAIIDKSFIPCDEAFHSFVNNRFIKELSPTLELVAELYGKDKLYYFLDSEFKRCSKKYASVEDATDKLIATLNNGKKVMLNALGKEVTPQFIDFESLNNHYVLQIDKHNNQCVVFNPNATTKNLSPKLSKTTLCQNYNLVLGDIDVGKGKKRSVIINADYPTQAYEVDPCIGLLMMSYLNGVRLNSHLINKVINNKAVIDSSLKAFNDCINQSVPKDEQTPITNRYNVCAKFLTRLKKSANYRIKRYEHQTEMLDQEVRQMDLEYSGYIADYEAQIAELEALKKQKEEEYKHNRVRKEEEIKLRGEEIDDEKGELDIKGTNAKKYKNYIENIKSKNPNASEELLEEEPEK